MLLIPPSKGKPIGRGERKKPPRHGFACHPSCRGEFTPYSPLEGCPKGGVGERNHPVMPSHATPLVEGNLFLIPLSEGSPMGGVGVKKPPQHIRICQPHNRGEFTSYSPQWRGARRAGW